MRLVAPQLYLLALPLDGDYSKIPETYREIISNAHHIIGEERKVTGRFMGSMQLHHKDFHLINEHSNISDIKDLAKLAFQESNITVFFSDLGTPCIADPDFRFVDLAYQHGCNVFSLPGESSITAALSVSGFDSSRFVYEGFAPKDKADLDRFYNRLSKCQYVTVFHERPYGMKQTVEHLKKLPNRICMSVNLGLEDEVNYRGRGSDIATQIDIIKAPFTMVMEPLHTKAAKKAT